MRVRKFRGMCEEKISNQSAANNATKSKHLPCLIQAIVWQFVPAAPAAPLTFQGGQRTTTLWVGQTDIMEKAKKQKIDYDVDRNQRARGRPSE